MSTLDWCLAVPAFLFFVLLFIACSVVMGISAAVGRGLNL